MSHLHERTEKTCLNCGASLAGRFCHVCGQENVEPKESFWHLLSHFFEDLTHFDGKFFSTIKFLLFKPGFLTQEYVKGRRASYLNPIRMYLFISAMFFLLFMSFWLPGNNKVTTSRPKPGESFIAIQKATHGIRTSLDSLEAADTVVSQPKTLAQYDSIQRALPRNKRDNALERFFIRKGYAVNEYSRANPEEFKHKFIEKFFHSLPYMLFISVPLIALWLKLLYVRRKQFFYVSHIIFTLHYYCLVFIALAFTNTISYLGLWGHVINIFITLGYYVYLYAAMLQFYKQGWFKTLVKYFLLLFLGLVSISVLTIADLVNALLNVA